MTDIEEIQIVEDQLAAVIGRLAIEFGRLELDVAELVTAAFGVADIDSRDAVDAVLSFRQKLDLVSALASSVVSTPQQLDGVRVCIRRLGEFEEQRNSLIHAFWGLERSQAETSERNFVRSKWRSDRKKGLVRTVKPADVEGIQALTEEIIKFKRLFAGESSLYSAASYLLRGANAKRKSERQLGA